MISDSLGFCLGLTIIGDVASGTMGSDLIARLEMFLETAGGVGVIVLGLLLLSLMFLSVLGWRMVLVALFVAALMFSGAAVLSLDAGSTLFRWTIIFALALTCIRGMRSPGLPAIMLGAVGFLALLSGLRGQFPLYSIQRSILLMVAALPMAAAIAHHLRTVNDVTRLLKMFLWAAGLYAVLGMAFLPSLRAGTRFAGGFRGAPLFIMTGGMLIPFVLWGAIRERAGVTRWYCVIVLICIGLICVISAQRTGAFAGFIGCLPLLIRFRFKKILAGTGLVLLAGVAVYVFAVLVPEQAAYVVERFWSTELSGRREIWAHGLALCLDAPWLGHGIGGLGEATGFHNAYLAVWYNGGLLALVIFTGAYLIMCFRSFKLIRLRVGAEINDIGRLFLGLSLACLATSFFEESIFSPSNMASFVGLTISIGVTRMRVLIRDTTVISETPERSDTTYAEGVWEREYAV